MYVKASSQTLPIYAKSKVKIPDMVLIRAQKILPIMLSPFVNILIGINAYSKNFAKANIVFANIPPITFPIKYITA